MRSILPGELIYEATICGLVSLQALFLRRQQIVASLTSNYKAALQPYLYLGYIMAFGHYCSTIFGTKGPKGKNNVRRASPCSAIRLEFLLRGLRPLGGCIARYAGYWRRLRLLYMPPHL